jgi:hypothetical protein
MNSLEFALLAEIERLNKVIELSHKIFAMLTQSQRMSESIDRWRLKQAGLS